MNEMIKMVQNILDNSVIVEKAATQYKGEKIVNFEKYLENGKPFKFENGDICAIAHLNAFTIEVVKEIAKKVSEKIPSKHLIDFIKENRLKDFVGISSPDYHKWKIGDEGEVRIEWNEKKEKYFAYFINKSMSTHKSL